LKRRSTIKVVLRNPITKREIDYNIDVLRTQLSDDWVVALKDLLRSGLVLEKNFCFLGFPNSPRTLDVLCNNLRKYIDRINTKQTQQAWINAGLKPYLIGNYAPGDMVATDLRLNHEPLNELHNHFERLQGTVDQLSPYYMSSDRNTKFAIRQLNNLCHEIESLVISKWKQATQPEYVRPAQITTWLTAPRYDIKPAHKKLFASNGFDRKLGGVYMHWCQIGKTYYEVWRDEGAPVLTDTVCEAITSLQYYSGEFDIEWGPTITKGMFHWHDRKHAQFEEWLVKNNLDPKDEDLSLGYLPLGYVDLEGSFGTKEATIINEALADHLDIFRIEVDDVVAEFPYNWTDPDWDEFQMRALDPGYRYHDKQN
jgi:hypothetical protein